MIQPESYPFTPILGWSMSRYDAFSTCRRRYYYQYYGKHDPEFARTRIDALKNLTSVPLAVGTIVHDAIAAVLERLLKSSSEIDVSRFGEFVSRKIDLTCAGECFFEVHYAEKEAVQPEDFQPLVHECMQTFFVSDRFQWVRESALGNEQHLIDPPGYGETRLYGMKAYAKVDFLFVVEDRVVILDWKTGKQDDDKHRKQLLAYSAWAASHLQRPPSEIEGITAYLRPTYREITVLPSQQDLDGLVAQIRAETAEMQGMCGDIDGNVPLAKDRFELTETRGYCKHCNFKELCGRT